MTDDLFQRLAAPFPADRVSWRVGSVTHDKKKAMALAYIDARDVMERLDAVCGPAGWERRHPHVDKTTTCEIAIWVEDRGWVVKSDGAGDTAVEAEKGSLSDSFKRAAVNWGIGRYLYDLASPWVEIDEWKKIKADQMPKLRALLSKDAPSASPAAGRIAPPDSAQVMTLSQRAKLLEDLMRSCKTPGDLRKAYAKGSKVCGELDVSDPERLVEINELYAKLFDELSERVAA